MAGFDMKAELQIGGTWTDVTTDVLAKPGIKHRRGRPDEGARVDPSACELTLRSPNGLYSNRNPNSPYYGLLGRNTPLRVSMAGSTPYLRLPSEAPTNIDRATTPDAAALDIAGDIDIRVDATFDNWGAPTQVEVMGKYGATGDRGWIVQLWQSKPLFFWSANGTVLLSAAPNAQYQPPMSGRMAIRVTLDVNNGAGGWTVRFYTAPTLAGTWTQLGDPVTGAGTTSIFATTTSLDLGAVNTLSANTATGRIYGAELRNGINGTVVANPDFTVQTPGASSFTDAAGRVWSTSGNASISNREYRFNGEVSAWPPRWHLSGNNVTAPVQGAGILRRLGQGQKALQSTLRRRIPSGNPIAYWPMEEGDHATRFYSPIKRVNPLRGTKFDLASATTLAGSSPLPMIQTGSTFSGARVPAPATVLGQWHTEFIFNYPKDTGPATERVLLQWTATGTVRLWEFEMSAVGFNIRGYDDGNVITSSLLDLRGLGVFNSWCRAQLFAVQNGSNVDWTARFIPIGGAGITVNTSYAGTVGRITSVNGPASYPADLNGTALGHISVLPVAGTTVYNNADIGFTGETAGTRSSRLTTEENVPFHVAGTTAGQTLVGPQTPQTLLTLLSEAEQADGGILYEERDRIGLVYRGRSTLYNQEPVLTVSYDQLTQPFDPVDDDSRIRNDVTVVRDGGSSSRAEVVDGPLSVSPPPTGVGVYDESVTLSLDDDDQTVDIAGWLAYLGTVDEARYPSLTLLLHKHPDLVPAVCALDIGDLVRVTDLPPQLPPGPVDLLVEGYSEDITPGAWTLTLVCSPASPWRVGVLDDPVLGRADTDGSSLASAATSTATTLSVATTAGPVWVRTAAHPAEFPFDVSLGGEQVTVTAISGATSPQTFTVVRSVNGIVKAQTAGADVRLTQPMILGL
ncbi:hypothetical protein [Streptomyces sp. NPDC059651]|uniref:hypothetical protein n=1 Tax=Streptomyces sp. NPDC059651 TaxID=3346897 RepID=UPI003673E7C1